MCLKTRISKLEQNKPVDPVNVVIGIKRFDGSTGPCFYYRDKPGVEVTPEDITRYRRNKGIPLVIRTVRRFGE